jgi:hypothetical protein
MRDIKELFSILLSKNFNENVSQLNFGKDITLKQLYKFYIFKY